MPSPRSIDSEAIRWSAPLDSTRPLLVLLHGRGANEEDLFGLAPLLPAGPVVASLRALHAEGPGFSWVPPRPPGVFEPAEEAVAAATGAVIDWLDGLGPHGPVALLGFSQGGAMSLQLLRERPADYRCAVVLSGFVFDGEQPGDAALAARRPPVFWGRGTHDEVIEEHRIARTAAFLADHATVEEHTYPTGHSVTPSEVRDIGAFLLTHLPTIGA